MSGVFRGFLSGDGGAAAAEMAMILPALALFLGGVADLGKITSAKVQLTAAARTGAQYGVDWAQQNGTGTSDASATDTAVVNGVSGAMGSTPATPSMVSGQSHYLYCVCVPTNGSGVGTATNCSSTCGSGQKLDTYVGLTVASTPSLPMPLPLLGLGSSMALTGQAILRVN